MSRLTDTQRELLRQAKEALREDREKSEALASLLKHPGWSVFVGLANGVAQSRGEGFFRPIEPNETLAQEFNKGTINGILMTLGLPHLIIHHMTSVIEPDKGDD